MQTVEQTSWAWWVFMVLVSVSNICLLIRTLAKHQPADSRLPPACERKFLRAAAVIFTVVCAYRSVLPRIDVPRICWFDTPLNWVFFGRSAATVAEVMWAAQMGLILRRVGFCLQETGHIPAQVAHRRAVMGITVIALAVTAECFSWTNLITESDLFSTVEQFLWSVLFLLTGVGLATLLPSWPKAPRAYSVFTFAVISFGLEQGWESLRLYLPRFLQEQADGVPFQSAAAGFHKLFACAQTTQSMAVWQDDMPWMTGYFSIGVWSAIWLAVAPLPEMPRSGIANSLVHGTRDSSVQP